MLLTIVGLILILVMSVLTFSSATENGRNPFLWTVITALVGLFFQFIAPVVMIIVLGAYWKSTGLAPDQLRLTMENIAFGGGIACLVLSFLMMLSSLKLASREVPVTLD